MRSLGFIEYLVSLELSQIAFFDVLFLDIHILWEGWVCVHDFRYFRDQVHQKSLGFKSQATVNWPMRNGVDSGN